jgi:hypothetical protein
MFRQITDFETYADSLLRELWHLSTSSHDYDNVARFSTDEDRAKVRLLHNAVSDALKAIRLVTPEHLKREIEIDPEVRATLRKRGVELGYFKEEP